MKNDKFDIMYLGILATLALAICTVTTPNKKITAIEYTYDCEMCGSTLAEGYESYVDGYTYEECKECGDDKSGE